AIWAWPAAGDEVPPGSDGTPAIATGFRAGGGAGVSFVHQALEGSLVRSTLSVMLHSSLEYGGRIRYMGRFSYGIPFYLRQDGETLPLDRESRASVAADTFQGVAVVFDPGRAAADGRSRIEFIPAAGVGANLTYVRPEDSATGPAPVTAIGPAFEAAVRFSVSDRFSVGVVAGAMVSVSTVEMAEERFGLSGVDTVSAFQLSPGLMFSF
ncbi:MAG: hypothetical protein ACOCZ9_02695, partial [Spirochaetota bacterium]